MNAPTPMDPRRWRQISRLVSEALERPTGERAAFVLRACEGDTALRDEVESLLAQEASADAFFARGAAELFTDPSGSGSPAPRVGLQSGSTLGNYQIERPIGRGGMGAVFLAYDTTLRRKVAIKIVDDDSDDRTSRASLLREARSVSTLSHPNICTIYEVSEAQGRAFIAMEYVDGRPLDESLKTGALPLEDVLRYGCEVTDALAHAHEHGVIHRDLKASNVILSTTGHVKIVDFGLARRVDALTADVTTATSPSGAGLVRGTPYAMAPEQVRGAATDERTDIWALGVLLYQMAAAAKPFDGPTVVELFSSILRDAPAPLAPRIPAPLQDVIHTCLAKDPRRRYQRAAEVRVALETIASAVKSSASADRPDAARREVRPSPPAWLRAPVLKAALVGALLVALVAIATPILPWHRGADIRSIAVLPLINLSQDPGQDFFVDGMTDGIINTLGRVTAVKVIARTSVMPFKGSKQSVAAIADELGVDAVLEGSATLARNAAGGESIRIAVNLIDPRTQTQIWSDTIERDLGSVLSLQGEIARTIAEKIKVVITADERRALETEQRVDPEAYKLYLLGRQAWNLRNEPGLKSAVNYFSQAIERAPAYAAAYAGLADTYVLLTGDIGGLPRGEGAAKAITSATKALELDPTLAEAHTSLAFVNFFLKWDFGLARDQFTRALQLNPSYATAHHWYGDYLSDMGHEDEALTEMHLALALDPLSPIISRDVAWPLFFGRRYQDAIQHLTQTLTKHAGYMPAERLLARSFAQAAAFDEAIRRFERITALDPGARNRCELAWAYARAGRRADAERELASAQARPPAELYPYDVALVYVALARTDDAFVELKRAFEERDPTMVNLKHDPRLDPLRSDPRYARLVALMRFPN